MRSAIIMIVGVAIVGHLAYRLPRIRWTRFALLVGSRYAQEDELRVALTIDDGPHPIATTDILEELSRHDVTATFFMTRLQSISATVGPVTSS